MTRQRRSTLGLVACAVLTALAGCRSASVPPPVVIAPSPPVWSLDKKVGAILRLEDQRWLDDGAGANLLNLVTDVDPNVRRRAALAIGRVGLAGTEGGTAALLGALADPDERVRASAAFALGLLHATAAADPLMAALADTHAVVKARAADALGLIFEPAGGSSPASGAGAAAAAAIANAATGCAAVMAPLAADEQSWPMTPDVDFCRAAILATTRIRNFDALAKIVLDSAGRPVAPWWPIAYGLQRVHDRRAADALAQMIVPDGIATTAFAFRGLGDYGDRRAVGTARETAARSNADVRLRVAAIDMLARLKDTGSVATLRTLLEDRTTTPNVSLEAARALGTIGDPKAFEVLADRFNHPWAPMRAAAFASAAKLDPDAFLLLVSGIALDKDWSVRAALAGVLGQLDPERVRSLVTDLAEDSDPRVQAPALMALAELGAPDLDARIVTALDAADFNVRATAAELIGRRKPANGAERLAAAYERGTSDANPTARVAVIEALAAFGLDAASPTLHTALGDRDWSVRLAAAARLRALGEAGAAPVRPAALRFPPEYFESPALLRPPYSPHAFLETKYGTIEIELNVVEAPMATESFVTLARKGYFNGMRIHRVVPNFVVQSGDDRGDGAGGPGYTLRDELSPLPYMRGTVGMALSGPDTGGSQFFITLSPQPHLDDKYAVFGRVVRGMEFVDQVSIFDVIERVRVWDGVSF
jgi:cyclophilin family peptidyl-prolyl cis-trans isomerase/HEAT repeat protein